MPTTKALKYRGDMLLHFPLLVDWGITNCRHIAGSSSWSQHAWGNAVDLHPLNKGYGDKAHAYILANAARLSIAHVLWQVPDHFDHIHADFNPQGVGTPPCAGGTLQWSGGTVMAASTHNCPSGFHWDGKACVKNTLDVPGGLDQKAGGLPFVGGIGDFLGKVVPILKIAAGGVIMFAGLGVILVGVTGQSNKVAGAAQAAYTRNPRTIARTATRERVRSEEASVARTAGRGRVVTSGGRVKVISKRKAQASDELAEDVADARKAERRATSGARLRGLSSKPRVRVSRPTTPADS